MEIRRACTFALITVALAWAMPAAAQLGPGPFAVFPTGDETDGRFLGFGCPGLATFEQGVSITISVPPDETSFTLNVFDGEGGLVDAAGNKHWDQGVGELVYRVYFDPQGSGNTNPADLVGTWLGNSSNPTSGALWTASSATMPDNEWWGLNVTTTAAAQSPAGPFLYHLTIDLVPGVCTGGASLVESNIKLAASSPLSFRVPRFGFVAAFRQFFNDGPILYPSEGTFPPADFTAAAATSTFDGTFTFRINLQETTTELRLYDGDFDHGTGPLVSVPSGRLLVPCGDLNDPDTLDDYSNLPAIIKSGLIGVEGAVSVGAPPDDNAFDAFRRGELTSADEIGCVRWTLTDPNGTVYRNDNPSGDREWEQFRIVSQLSPDAGDTTKVDATAATPTLPTGIWTVDVFALDLSNLNFWFVEADVCAERELQDPLPDIDFDTGADGASLPAGTLVAEQWASQGVHFASGDPTYPLMIFDSASPTGGDSDLGTPHTDFGGPGVGSGGASGQPGENRVARGKVLILSEDGDASDPDDNAAGGTIVVTFDRPVNVAAVELLDTEETGGSIDAFDAGGSFLGNVAIPSRGDNGFVTVAVGIAAVSRLEINLAGSAAVTAIRFDRNVETEPACPSPTYLVGDTVWLDGNSNGVQDPGEPGIPDVLVNLYRDPLQPPIRQVVTGDTSSPDFTLCQLNNTGLDDDGLYCFGINLPAGYTVEIDPSNFAAGGALAGLVSTTGGETQSNILVNDNVLTYDFGYVGAGPGVCLDDLDFEGLAKGTIVDDEFAAQGIQVTTNDPVNHPAMIFDSANPSGGDFDLGSPNQDFGGPGIGAGGGAGQPGANSTALGKILIISEDGDSSDPDDNGAGGTIIFTFAQAVRLDAVQILDIDEGMAGTVTAFDAANNVIGMAGMANNLGDNSFQTVVLGAEGVRRLEVFFPGSGAVAGIVFCADCLPVTVRDEFNSVSFGNNDGPDDWAGNWVENDVAGPGPGAGNVRVSSGRLVLFDKPDTGTHPSAARRVDLSGSLAATFSFDFWTTAGVDSSDAIAIEASSNGGATWTVLETLTGIVGASSGSRSYDITGFASSQTMVRFRVSNLYGASDEFFKADNVQVTGQCVVCSPVTVRDDFSTVSFHNNDGADDWDGGWVEYDVAGAGPGSGHVRVLDGRLKLFDNPDTGTDPSAARRVDLSGTLAATFSFDFWTTAGVDTSDAIAIEVSSNGGASWTVLETLTGIYGATSGSRSYDITGFISSQTMVRFRVSNLYGGSDEFFKADNVQVAGQCVACSPVTVADQFGAVSFGNNDGPNSWSGNWVEDDVAGPGAGGGHVRILDGRLKLFDNPDTGTDPSAARKVDLSGTGCASFSFDFWTTSGVDTSDAIAIEVSSDGGASWTVLETLTGISGAKEGWRSYDITGFISSQTMVRFRVSNLYGGSDEFFKVDNVVVDGRCDC